MLAIAFTSNFGQNEIEFEVDAPNIETSRDCLRLGTSFKTCTARLPQADIDQLAKEFPQQAAAPTVPQPADAPTVNTDTTPSVTPKKFFDVKNPMMWIAIGGAVVGVTVLGSMLKSSANAARASTMSRRSRRR
jgi:hypothetical protein